MPINLEKKILFLHVTKTGGTSIEYFFDMFNSDSLYNPKNIYLFAPQHYPLEVLKKIIVDYDRLFKFCFVRNPYSRMLSEYFYSKKETIFDPDDFHEWLIIFLSRRIDHNELQSRYVDETINFVGRFETLQSDFEELKIKLIDFWGGSGIAEPENFRTKNLEHLNASTINCSEMKQESKDIIADFYKEDFINFGYDF
jgi:hypothetical protein